MVKPVGLWSRPSPFSLIGVRPNSPPQTTSVLVEQAARFQILEQAGDRLVHRAAELGVVLLDLRVRVPLAARAVVELHEAHAALDQPPREQAHAAQSRRSLFHRCRRAASRVFGFLREIDRLGRLGLHAEGEFVAGDARLEFASARRVAACARFSCVEEIQLAALLRRRSRPRAC